MTHPPAPPPAAPKPRRARPAAQEQEPGVFSGGLLPWLFLAPTLIVLGLFIYYPALETFRMALSQANLILNTEKFVGLRNFAELLSSPAYHQVLLQTLVFTALVVGISLLLSVWLAWLVRGHLRGSSVYRLLLIYPYALSPALAGVLWLFMFNPDIGVVNQLLGAVAGVQPRWLDNPWLAFGLVTAAAIWKGLAYNIIFYVSAMQNLPQDVLEAAQIDGANSRQTFWSIVYPLLSPVTFFLLFAGIVSALFDSFALVDMLTRGGPYTGNAGVTTFLVYQLYQDGFVNYKTGLAAAQAVLMLGLVGFITWMQFRVGEKRVHYGG
ncbi:carbohydrate ABC transporter permease [Deinococcus lacus]|uniref:Carbohydrate ABC transporter permease n=1 Tax=Deinococcus lacus TaxID=392561 RepID=A0ABW1YCD6_9DEIO